MYRTINIRVFPSSCVSSSRVDRRCAPSASIKHLQGRGSHGDYNIDDRLTISVPYPMFFSLLSLSLLLCSTRLSVCQPLYAQSLYYTCSYYIRYYYACIIIIGDVNARFIYDDRKPASCVPVYTNNNNSNKKKQSRVRTVAYIMYTIAVIV